MYQIERLNRVPTFDDTRNVDLARSLADHFDVDVTISKCGKHPSGNSDEVTHFSTNEGENGHVFMDGDLKGGTAWSGKVRTKETR